LFGVDIDSQAVEVTKLSLFLKLLEEENEQTVGQQLKITDRVLPDIASNITCGNSLIGPEFFEHDDLVSHDADVMYRINMFDWTRKFPDIMKSGGFDVIIGNPPYIRIQELQNWAGVETEYYNRQYQTAGEGNYDIYVVFVERALELMRRGGTLGFILPNRFFNVKYGTPLRALLSAGRNVQRIVNFGHEQVFEGARTYTCLLFLDKEPTSTVQVVNVASLKRWQVDQDGTAGVIPSESLSESEWHLAFGADRQLLDKLTACPLTLENVTDRIFQGLKTSADKIYIVEERERKRRSLRIYSRQLEKEFLVEPDLFHMLVKGGDSKRYHLSSTNRLILFPYENVKGSWRLIPADTFQRQYPQTWNYLSENKKYLEEREKGKMKGDRWYGYIYPKALGVISESKIFTPDIALHASYSLDETGNSYFTGGAAGGYGIVVSPRYSREYILGLLNSRLHEWFIRKTAIVMSGGYYSYESRFIKHLPIRSADPDSKQEGKVRAQVIRLVERMLLLNKTIDAAKTPFERDSLREQRNATDGQIDRLVYDIYNLTPEEIEAVERETERASK
ncbi:MAG: Eco57I restriction-modification methylase domain-containing protein, partial [Bacteroidota bacterium]